jgi:hypothetical protein
LLTNNKDRKTLYRSLNQLLGLRLDANEHYEIMWWDEDWYPVTDCEQLYNYFTYKFNNPRMYIKPLPSKEGDYKLFRIIENQTFSTEREEDNIFLFSVPV